MLTEQSDEKYLMADEDELASHLRYISSDRKISSTVIAVVRSYELVKGNTGNHTLWRTQPVRNGNITALGLVPVIGIGRNVYKGVLGVHP